MTSIENITQSIFALPIADQVRVMSAIDHHISKVLGYDDPNIAIAEQRLADYRAGKMDALPWDEVKKKIFD